VPWFIRLFENLADHNRLDWGAELTDCSFADAGLGLLLPCPLLLFLDLETFVRAASFR
jgi:hypothetical protein